METLPFPPMGLDDASMVGPTGGDLGTESGVCAPTSPDITTTEFEVTPQNRDEVEVEIPPTQPIMEEYPMVEIPVEDYPEIPATQPFNFENVEDAKESAGIPSPEVKETFPEVPATTEIPKAPESPQYPMMTRESQQAFKDAKGRVQKMDGVSQVPEAEKGQGKKRSDPTAKGKAKAKAKVANKRIKTEPEASMALPVGIDDPRRNLLGDFEEVIDSDVEVGSPSPKPKDLGKVPKGKAKASPKPKRAPKARASPKLKRAAKAKASPKLKRAAKAKASPQHKASSKGKGKAKASPKGSKQDKVEKSGDGDEGKKTFARRNCPQKLEARLRFEVLRDVFNNSILPQVAQEASYLEAEVFI